MFDLKVFNDCKKTLTFRVYIKNIVNLNEEYYEYKK